MIFLFLDGELEKEDDEVEQEENNQLASTATSVLFSLKADLGSLEARFTNIVIFTPLE